MNARENRNDYYDFSLDLNVPSESLSVTVLGREFQVAGAEQRNARLANAVLANGSDNRVHPAIQLAMDENLTRWNY